MNETVKKCGDLDYMWLTTVRAVEAEASWMPFKGLCEAIKFI